MANEYDLTPWLLEKIQNGECVLFLGAGASYGAMGPSGEVPLSGEALRDKLADRFLGGAFKDRPLSQVAEFSKSQSSLYEVQQIVAESFKPLEPAEFHLNVPLFRWHAIVTTNYDLVVERAYSQQTNGLQTLTVKTRNGDHLHDRSQVDDVPYLKLHGCVNTINDEKLPLILGSEEYAKHQANRDRLFGIFKDWGVEHPIIFCGYKLADPNLQQIFYDLTDSSFNRPQYALVDPSLEVIEQQYWQSKRVLPLKLTFEDFLNKIAAEIPEQNRVLAALREPDSHSIQKWVSKGKPTNRLISYLSTELTHVYSGMSMSGSSAKDFYRGDSSSWWPIVNDLDVRRRITDDLLLEAILDKEDQVSARLFLVKGYAGSGKTTTLRRFALSAAEDFNGLVLWLNESGNLNFDLIKEIHQITQEIPVVIVDDAVLHINDIEQLLRFCQKENVHVTIVAGARTNEWNVSSGELEGTVYQEFELRDLSDSEIDQLIGKLEANDSLGELKDASLEERRGFFQLTAERQLLVALHEATLGEDFSGIVLDEYRNIASREAQVLYLDICTLHRFRVGVRAGLVSRISGITLTHFQERLFSPLEHVIHVYSDYASKDWAYRTRHPVIADIVFKTVLEDQAERVLQIVRVIRNMNVDYESDRLAFDQLIKGRDIAELFGDKALGDQIFSAANEAGSNRAHVEHQRAVFELNHPGGNANVAMQAILNAENATENHSNAILHTKAMALRQLGNEAKASLEKQKHRADAKAILKGSLRKSTSSYFHHSLCEILFDELQDVSESTNVTASDRLQDRLAYEIHQELEKTLSEGLQKFPADTFLTTLEARVAEFLNDSPRAMETLQRSFESNPDNGFVALQLAKVYEKSGQHKLARETLETNLQRNPTNRNARYHLARLLMAENETANLELIRSNLRSSFTDGDTNYESQFWFARHEVLFGDTEKGKALFKTLSKLRLAPNYKNRIRGQLTDINSELQAFTGGVTNVRDSYCFVHINELGTDAFFHASDLVEGEWESVSSGTILSCNVGFNFRGVCALNGKVQGTPAQH